MKLWQLWALLAVGLSVTIVALLYGYEFGFSIFMGIIAATVLEFVFGIFLSTWHFFDSIRWIIRLFRRKKS